MKATPEQADRLHRFAHDLRNRLAAIQQMLAQLGDAGPSDRAELIAFAELQYFKAMRASEELLDDFGVERGAVELKRAPTDLKQLVEQEIAQLAHRFERKQQAVVADLAEGIVADADPHWIGQLVAALLSNASKFSPPGAAMHVVLDRHDGMARLRVRDAGIGMDAEDLAQVFTRYAVLKGRSTAGEAQGRGTLARALQWAQAHGGSLTAESPGAGQGACFTLLLPLSRPTGA
jgi:signal transduction histidine kinase